MADALTLREVHGLDLTALHGPPDLLPGLPQRPGWVAQDGSTILWTAPRQWLVLHAPGAAPAVPEAHRTPLHGARCILELTGPRAAELLATLLPIDLHPRAFPPGAAAATLGAHVPLLVWRVEAGFRLACYRSYGQSLQQALVAAGRGRGLVVSAMPPSPNPLPPPGGEGSAR
ncbi:sarcosine oxidase subunit gamma [Falsiroseomonas sp. HC035]|uniref:sarcosine oxidase subunit gamma n=1 Tax=Falsiroseomonas sp. HC035 TaxID=3390999 RepID=UPI003D322F41